MELEHQLDTTSNSEYHDAECGSNIENSYENDPSLDLEIGLQRRSIISEIRDELSQQDHENIVGQDTYTERCKVQPIQMNQEISETNPSSSKSTTKDVEDIDYLHDSDWRSKEKHIFILSEAGKPIYSLHGNEDKLANLFGIIQALVSFVQHGQDSITSIESQGMRFVFLIKNNLILVAVSRCKMSVDQLQMQLSDVYNQIVSILTYANVAKIFEKRKNFDLRRLLAGSERLIQRLVTNDNTNGCITNNLFTFLTNSVRILPMQVSVRTCIVNTIKDNCSKIKNLVFAVLIANNCLIALVRMKKYFIHPADLRLIFNLVECSESFKTSENWTPICLPRFDMNGYLYAHVSYLSDECQACLLLLSVDKDDFFILSEAKRNITEKLGRSHHLEAINESMLNGFRKCNRCTIGIQELRHFLYKPKSLAQLLYPELMAPYNSTEGLHILEGIYCNLLSRIHNKGEPLKLIFKASSNEIVLGWVTSAYELFAVFEPIVSKSSVIRYVDKLIKWIEKEYDTFFIRSHPTF